VGEANSEISYLTCCDNNSRLRSTSYATKWQSPRSASIKKKDTQHIELKNRCRRNTQKKVGMKAYNALVSPSISTRLAAPMRMNRPLAVASASVARLRVEVLSAALLTARKVRPR
jgi:hypothetical protein